MMGYYDNLNTTVSSAVNNIKNNFTDISGYIDIISSNVNILSGNQFEFKGEFNSILNLTGKTGDVIISNNILYTYINNNWKPIGILLEKGLLLANAAASAASGFAFNASKDYANEAISGSFKLYPLEVDTLNDAITIPNDSVEGSVILVKNGFTYVRKGNNLIPIAIRELSALNGVLNQLSTDITVNINNNYETISNVDQKISEAVSGLATEQYVIDHDHITLSEANSYVRSNSGYIANDAVLTANNYTDQQVFGAFKFIPNFIATETGIASLKEGSVFLSGLYLYLKENGHITPIALTSSYVNNISGDIIQNYITKNLSKSDDQQIFSESKTYTNEQVSDGVNLAKQYTDIKLTDYALSDDVYNKDTVDLLIKTNVASVFTWKGTVGTSSELSDQYSNAYTSSNIGDVWACSSLNYRLYVLTNPETNKWTWLPIGYNVDITLLTGAAYNAAIDYVNNNYVTSTDIITLTGNAISTAYNNAKEYVELNFINNSLIINLTGTAVISAVNLAKDYTDLKTLSAIDITTNNIEQYITSNYTPTVDIISTYATKDQISSAIIFKSVVPSTSFTPQADVVQALGNMYAVTAENNNAIDNIKICVPSGNGYQWVTLYTAETVNNMINVAVANLSADLQAQIEAIRNSLINNFQNIDNLNN